MLQFIEKWGYIGLFFGSLIEGESIVLAISSMAYFGKFYLPKVMLIAFLGTVLADQISFYIGKFVGHKMLIKYPKLEKRSRKIFRLLEKYDVPFILGFRFIYGIRIISPFFIGLSHISIFKFTFLNILSGIVWSVLSCLLGYYIGAFSKIIGKNYDGIAILFNLGISAIIILIFHFLSKKLGKHSDEKDKAIETKKKQNKFK